MFTITSVFFIALVFPLFGKGTTDDTTMIETDTTMSTDDNKGMEDSPIIPFDNMDQVMMLAETKPTVLYFKANWCPSCLEASEKFQDDIDQLKDINLVVVNYDNSEELQLKYGVTYQHTFVQVSSTGEAMVSWNGGATAELLKKIKKGNM